LEKGVLRLSATLAALIMLLTATWPLAGHAQTPPSPNVQADLLSARAEITPGEHFTIALRQRIREGWHTYWRNPGDSGLPTRLTWHLPPGWRAGAIQWPPPTAMRFATLMSYVYSGEVLFPIEMTAPRSLRPGEAVTLNAEGDWLVCSDICIPEHATLSLILPIAAQAADDPHWAPRIAQAVASLPAHPDTQVRVTRGDPAVLSIALADAPAIRDPYFFPNNQDAINHAAP
jgi:DsbC/DsbD-like thiol-disulfide interchange protein